MSLGSNQPDLCVFSYKLQLKSIWVDLNPPRLATVSEWGDIPLFHTPCPLSVTCLVIKQCMVQQCFDLISDDCKLY